MFGQDRSCRVGSIGAAIAARFNAAMTKEIKFMLLKRVEVVIEMNTEEAMSRSYTYLGNAILLNVQHQQAARLLRMCSMSKRIELQMGKLSAGDPADQVQLFSSSKRARVARGTDMLLHTHTQHNTSPHLTVNAVLLHESSPSTLSCRTLLLCGCDI
jgi:hypothetical protein